METIIDRACGLDVHQQSITACIMGNGMKTQIKQFGTTTSQLESLKQWLIDNNIIHVAMESTGVYWVPVFNIIGDDFKLLLVNARHIKNVPGKKTDVKDAQWICKLLRAGLLKGSFIPPKDIRDLRNLTRYQKQLQNQIKSEKNRVHKLLQEGNIKITSVLTDIFGVAGMNILHDLSNGIVDPKELVKHMENDKRLMRKKSEALEALKGKFDSHHQFMLKEHLELISFLENKISSADEKVKELLKNHQKDHELLQTIPGVSTRSANILISEIGTNMDVFPDENHLSSWAGLSPGNNESAGKKKSTRIGQGNKWLKTVLIQIAWSATRQKDSYLASKYYQLKQKLGSKKALVAVAHKILKYTYLVMKHKQEYKDLGPSYLCKNKKEKLVGYYVKKLSSLGYVADLKPADKIS